MSVALVGTPTTVDSATSTTVTIGVPGGSSNDGSWLVAFLQSRGNTTWTPPSGWTAITDGVTTLDDHDSTIITGKAYARFDDGSLGSSQSWTTTGTTGNGGCMLRFSGVHPTTPIHKTSKNNSAGTIDGTPVALSVTTTVAAYILVMETVSNSTTATPPSGYTEQVDFKMNTGTTFAEISVDTKAQGSAGATGNQTVTTAGAPAGRWVAFQLAIAPSSGGTDTGGTVPAITTVPDKSAGDGISLTDWNTSIRDNINASIVTQIGARAYKAAGPATTATDAVILLDTERYDTDALHSIVTNTGRMTVNKGGVYLVGGGVVWPADTGLVAISIRLNGTTTVARSNMISVSGGTGSRQSLMTLWNATSGDYFELLAASANSLTITAEGNDSPEFWLARI